MAYIEIKPKSNFAPPVPADKVVISSRPSPRKAGRLLLVFQAGEDVKRELRWQKGQMVSVFWGTDKDRGKLEIRLAKPNIRAFKLGGYSDRILTVSLAVYPEDYAGHEYRKEIVGHEVFDLPGDVEKYLLVRLPKNFYVVGEKSQADVHGGVVAK